MAKFKVKVTVKAQCDYEVEVDESTEAHAEDNAGRMWRDKMPSDFQVESGYVTDWEMETEQLTADCPDCGIEHTVPTATRTLAESDCWHEDTDYCKPCGAKMEAEDKANG